MKKIFSKIIFLLSCFLFIIIVPKADSCNYKEKANLIKEANNINFNYEIIDKTNEMHLTEEDLAKGYNMRDYYYIQMNLMNLTNNLYVEITNNQNDDVLTYHYSDLVDGIVSFKTDSYRVVTYTATIYAQTANCSEKLMTKKVKSPKFNTYYQQGLCTEIPDYKYCQQLLTTELSDNDIGNNIFKYYQKQLESKEQKTKKENNVKKYLIIGGFVLAFVIAIGVISFVIIRKRRKI